MTNTARSPRRQARLRSALLAIPLTAGLLGAACSTPAQDASASRSTTSGPTTASNSLTCAGVGIDPTAKLHHRTETLIKAPLRTEESWTGDQIEAAPNAITYLAPGLDAWLAALKTAAEAHP